MKKFIHKTFGYICYLGILGVIVTCFGLFTYIGYDLWVSGEFTDKFLSVFIWSCDLSAIGLLVALATEPKMTKKKDKDYTGHRCDICKVLIKKGSGFHYPELKESGCYCACATCHFNVVLKPTTNE